MYIFNFVNNKNYFKKNILYIQNKYVQNKKMKFQFLI